ncbi:MAG: cytochrome c-type biogenesis protein, partial [Pseudomonadota bacterium]
EPHGPALPGWRGAAQGTEGVGGACGMIRTLLILLMLAVPAQAIQPDEVLDDPALEARARTISAELRCVVCQNESIDFSSAEIARDLRLLVRERLVAGDTDAEVKAFMVARYGEFVLLRPVFSARNAALWLAGPVLLLIGAALSFAFIRRRPAASDAPLSAEEKARLDDVLKD